MPKPKPKPEPEPEAEAEPKTDTTDTNTSIFNWFIDNIVLIFLAVGCVVFVVLNFSDEIANCLGLRT